MTSEGYSVSLNLFRFVYGTPHLHCSVLASSRTIPPAGDIFFSYRWTPLHELDI
jgi:hypothetical protein